MTTRRAARWSKLALVAAGILALAGLTITPSYAASNTQIYIAQGVLGKQLDIQLDGETVAKGVMTSAVVGPFNVDPGSRTVTLSEDTTQVAGGTFSIEDGFEADVVAHSPASPGGQTLTVNPYRPVKVPKGKALISVSHNVMDMGPADIRVNGEHFRVTEGSYSEPIVVRAGTGQLTMVPADQSTASLVRTFDVPAAADSVNHFIAMGLTEAEYVGVVSSPAATTGSPPPREGGYAMGTGGQAVGEGPSFYVDLVR